MTQAQKNTLTIVKGNDALTKIRVSSKTFSSPLANFAEGQYVFSDEITEQSYTDARTGEERTGLAIIAKKGNSFELVPLATLRAKEPIYSTPFGDITNAAAQSGEDDLAAVYMAVKGKTLTLSRVAGYRRSTLTGRFYRGKFEVWAL